jgi:hypothetical protein
VRDGEEGFEYWLVREGKSAVPPKSADVQSEYCWTTLVTIVTIVTIVTLKRSCQFSHHCAQRPRTVWVAGNALLLSHLAAVGNVCGSGVCVFMRCS